MDSLCLPSPKPEDFDVQSLTVKAFPNAENLDLGFVFRVRDYISKLFEFRSGYSSHPLTHLISSDEWRNFLGKKVKFTVTPCIFRGESQSCKVRLIPPTLNHLLFIFGCNCLHARLELLVFQSVYPGHLSDRKWCSGRCTSWTLRCKPSNLFTILETVCCFFSVIFFLLSNSCASSSETLQLAKITACLQYQQY